MRRTVLFGSLLVGLTAGLVLLAHSSANASGVPSPNTDGMAAEIAASDGPATLWQETVNALAKRCSFDSDCPYGKCRGNKCGGCSFNSDCKGWGVCRSGQCGGCSFNSDCKGFGSCRNNRCEKSPY